jgi:hypothetical protein
MITHRARLLAGAAAFALAGCRGEPTVARLDPAAVRENASAANSERSLAIELTTAARGDAGMIFSIDGPNIVGVTPASGFDLVATPTSSRGRDRVDVLLVGPLRGGVIAWLTVKGVNSGQPYDVTVSQVAAGADQGYVQRDPGAYEVVVRR